MSQFFQPPEIDTGNSQRVTAVAGLSALYGLRLLGMYLVLPVLSLYAANLRGETALLIGMSLGIYGFSQALFQIPFGIWSDRYGRRRVIAMGLLLFAIGSAVAAQTHSIYGLILGRFLQGSGAVASALVALMADLSGPRYRARAMGAVGVSVGIAFAMGMVFGPAVYQRMGAPAIFWLTAILSVLGVIYVGVGVPKVREWEHDHEMEWTRGQSTTLLHHPTLLRLDAGILVLHLLVTAAFVVGPTYLSLYRPVEQHGSIYAPIVLAGVVVLAISVFVSDRFGRLREAIVLGGILLLASAVFLLFATRGLVYSVAVIACMVGGIAIAEPAMPALLTSLVSADQRGTAAGIFHTSQFTGSFLGGMAGGAMLRHPKPVGLVLVGIACIWVVISLGLLSKRSSKLSSSSAAPASGREGKTPGGRD